MQTEQVSRIYIEGKRLGQMRQIVEDTFGESLLSIDVKMPDRIFVIRLENNVDVKKMEFFTHKHKQCRIEVFPRIEFCVFRGKKQLIPSG